MKNKAIGLGLCLGSALAFAQAVNGIIYEFTGGDVTNGAVVTEGIDGTSSLYTATEYVESGFRMRVEGSSSASISIGNYYSSGNAVIHGHWSSMEKVVFEQEDGSAFDLNYYKLTSNPLPGQGGAGGNGIVSIVASEDGITESFRSTLPAEDWGDDSVTEVYLGPEFDGIKAFWFETDTVEFKCFGMDTFYIDRAPPPPSTDNPIIVGSGTVEDAVQDSAPEPAAPATPVPTLAFYALLALALLLGGLGIRQLRA